jgi:hypothetical protein
MRSIQGIGVVWLLLAGLLVGCGRGQTPVPAGAQQVHVAVTESEVRLNPATVRAGDVYVVLDTPGSSVGFAQRQRTAAETPGPFSDAQLDSFSHGDGQGTAISGFDDTSCSDAQRAEDRGMQGYCGNVFKVVLAAGKYAFFLHRADGVTPRSVAVLEVLP